MPLPRLRIAYYRSWLVGFVLLLAGCGFQPRGATFAHLENLPQPLMLSGLGDTSPLSREFKAQLHDADVTLVTSRQEAASILQIIEWKRDSRILSVDSRNKAVEYELEELVRFALRKPSGEELIVPENVRVLRIQYRPPTSILGSSRESELLREDMLRDVVGRILQRLAVLE